jgi:hypothetical protein
MFKMFRKLAVISLLDESMKPLLYPLDESPRLEIPRPNGSRITPADFIILPVSYEAESAFEMLFF